MSTQPSVESSDLDADERSHKSHLYELYTSEQLMDDLKSWNFCALPRECFNKTLDFDTDSFGVGGKINLRQSFASLYSRFYNKHSGSSVDFYKHPEKRFDLIKKELRCRNLSKKQILTNSIWYGKKEHNTEVDTAFYLDAIKTLEFIDDSTISKTNVTQFTLEEEFDLVNKSQDLTNKLVIILPDGQTDFVSAFHSSFKSQECDANFDFMNVIRGTDDSKFDNRNKATHFVLGEASKTDASKYENSGKVVAVFTDKATHTDKKIGVYAIEVMKRNPKTFSNICEENFEEFLEKAIQLSMGVISISWNGARNRSFYCHYVRKLLKFLPCLSIYLKLRPLLIGDLITAARCCDVSWQETKKLYCIKHQEMLDEASISAKKELELEHERLMNQLKEENENLSTTISNQSDTIERLKTQNEERKEEVNNLRNDVNCLTQTIEQLKKENQQTLAQLKKENQQTTAQLKNEQTTIKSINKIIRVMQQQERYRKQQERYRARRIERIAMLVVSLLALAIAIVVGVVTFNLK